MINFFQRDTYNYLVMGLIKRTSGSSNTSIFITLCKALMRSVLEYAIPVWSPYLAKDVQTLESIQRRASRIALTQKRGEIPCRLLNWDKLEKRRKYFSLIECYDTVFGLNDIVFEDVLEYRHAN